MPTVPFLQLQLSDAVKYTVRARTPAKAALGTGIPTNKGLIPRH